MSEDADRPDRGPLRPPILHGENNGRWIGGVRVTEKGYLRISAGPLRGMLVHRLVAEAKLGRPLAEDEDVHHINGDRSDPRPGNLEVRKVQEHRPFLNGKPWTRCQSSIP